MQTRAELKANAKQALTGKWGKGALITLCYLLVMIGINFAIAILSFIPFIGIATTIVSIPIMLGLIFSFIKLKRGEEVGAFDFLKLGFQNFKRSWCIFGRTLQKMLAPIIAMCIIMVVMMISGGVAVFSAISAFADTAGGLSSSYNDRIPSKGSFSFDYDFSDYGYDLDDISYTTNPYARSSTYSSNPYARGNSYSSSSSSASGARALANLGVATGGLILLFILMIAMWGVSIWATVKGLLYALAYYIAYDNQEMSAKDVVQRSEDLMKGNRGKLFVLQLSFIGWAILACFTLGIGYFWLIPYMMVTLVCFYEALLGGNNGNTYAASSQNVNVMNNTNNNVNTMNNTNMMNSTNNINTNMNSQYNNPMAQNMNNAAPQDMSQLQNVNNTMPQDMNNMNQAPEVTEYIPVNLEPNTNTNQFNQPIENQPTNQINQPTPEPTVNQYNPVTSAPNVNQYNPTTPAPETNQYNPTTPTPETNQYNLVTPAPDVNQYNPVTPTSDVNQYNQPTPAPDANQFNPVNNDLNNPNNNNM